MSVSTDHRERLQSLLEETSRTFALAIPLLPEPLRTQVTEAYLLFRIADTFEDATEWSADRRIEALDEFVAILEGGEDAPDIADAARRWTADPPLHHEGYLRLLEHAPLVHAVLQELDPAAARIMVAHTVRTSRGMASFLERAGADSVVRLHSLEELRSYCYAVAGIVGEMLTELFLLECPQARRAAPRLRARARGFGEALQLVNVLRDSAADVQEGRALVPSGVSRDGLFQLAREDLQEATEYTLTLQRSGAADGVVAFNALPVLLAQATLDRVQEEGPGSKISRVRVWTTVARLRADLRFGRPVIRTDRGTPASRPA